VISPTAGSGRTVATLMLAMTFGRVLDGHVLAWAPRDESAATAGIDTRALLRAEAAEVAAGPGSGALVVPTRRLDHPPCDVLAHVPADLVPADALAATGPYGTARDALEPAYRVLVVDPGAEPDLGLWYEILDASDQLVVTMSAVGPSAQGAARLLATLERDGRQRLVREAVTVATAAPSRIRVDASGSGGPAVAGGIETIERHFGGRTRAVHVVPHDRAIGAGGPIDLDDVATATRDAWLRIAIDVADGL
jgi:MinD-like ATPase involved in chromosome partitioning or flagellar assembly